MAGGRCKRCSSEVFVKNGLVRGIRVIAAALAAATSPIRHGAAGRRRRRPWRCCSMAWATPATA